jgi:hypothetical protein
MRSWLWYTLPRQAATPNGEKGTSATLAGKKARPLSEASEGAGLLHV